MSRETKRIDWLAGGTSERLHRRRHEALREEEGGDPEGHGRPVLHPAANELDTIDQVLDPGSERLERRETDIVVHPDFGDLVIDEAVEDSL